MKFREGPMLIQTDPLLQVEFFFRKTSAAPTSSLRRASSWVGWCHWWMLVLLAAASQIQRLPSSWSCSFIIIIIIIIIIITIIITINIISPTEQHFHHENLKHLYHLYILSWILITWGARLRFPPWLPAHPNLRGFCRFLRVFWGGGG